MAMAQGADGSSPAVNRGDAQSGPGGGLRLAAVILVAVSASLAFVGLLSFVGRFLFPTGLPGAVVQLLEAGVILLVPAAVLSAISAVLARRSRARRAAGCALGILAICLLFIGTVGYLYMAFAARQRLAAWQCKPGYRLTFSCQSHAGGLQDADALRAARWVVAKRLDPLALGWARVAVTPPDRMTVDLDRRVVPRWQERLDGLVSFVQQRGILEFRILPTIDREELTAAQIERQRQALSENGPGPASDGSYAWIAIKDISEWHAPASIVEQFASRHYVLASNKPGEVMLREPDGGGWSIENASATQDDMGRRAIGFRLDEQGGNLFWNLTSKNGDRPLAIVLDDVVISAPMINAHEPIGRSGIIMGTFTVAEVHDMAGILNCKPLPLDLSLLDSAWQD